MIQFIFTLLGFLFPNQNANALSQDNRVTIVQSPSESLDGDTNGEIGQIPPKK